MENLKKIANRSLISSIVINALLTMALLCLASDEHPIIFSNSELKICAGLLILSLLLSIFALAFYKNLMALILEPIATNKSSDSSVLNRLSSSGEKIMLEANDGKSKIYGNGKIFKLYIDDDFKNWGLNKNSQTTAETLVDVYEIIKDAKFAEIFTSLNCDLNKLVMTQAQIVRFCEKHPTWLRQDGNATLFLIKENDEYFVVLVFVYAGGLYVRVYRFDFDRVWHAACRLRVVFPQLIA